MVLGEINLKYLNIYSMNYLKLFEEFGSNKNNSEQDQFIDIKGDLKKMIEKSLSSSDEKTIKNFVDSYIRDSEKNQIEGLINDSDIYEFYLKYRNVIDEILSKDNFYEKKPSELDSFSLYDYTISGTKFAVKKIIGMIQSDLKG